MRLNPRRALARLPFRARLAAAFSGLFLLAGAALLGFVVLLARYGTTRQVQGMDITPTSGTPQPAPGASEAPFDTTTPAPGPVETPSAEQGIAVRLVDHTVRAVQDAALHQMLLWSGIGLGLEGHTLTVANTGPPVPADRVAELFEPFRRLGQDRTGTGQDSGEDSGHGLGLSIVCSIADAHDATLTTEPGTYGGLTIAVSFSPIPATRP